MSRVPTGLQYSDDHVWIRPTESGTRLSIGITDFAQQELGDIVAVTLPAIGANVQANVACADIESTKSVSDIISPVSGTVVARNDSAEEAPEKINSDPYDEGWLFEVDPAPTTATRELSALKNSVEYARLIGG
jgi:glycine cleavage system H protein